MKDMDIMVTLWPSFSHFSRFASDSRLSGIRLNSAMINVPELDTELALLSGHTGVPLYFDIKGRQLRITKVHPDYDFLDFELNHPINVNLPVPILFKGGEDAALLVRLADEDLGNMVGEYGHPVDSQHWYQRLAVQLGPKYLVNPGESIHIRDVSLRVGGAQFTDVELAKIEKVKNAGIRRWFLSYVESQRDVDEFVELVGKDSEIILKIENNKGLEYVEREFQKRDGLRLCAAQGDLYVELDRPHQILSALKLIIEKDRQAVVGSRMMLSVVKKVPYIFEVKNDGGEIIRREIRHSIEDDVPSCADFEQLAWLYDIGYRNFMLCDEMCLREELLSVATNALWQFKQDDC